MPRADHRVHGLSPGKDQQRWLKTAVEIQLEHPCLTLESLQTGSLEMPCRHDKGPEVSVRCGHPCGWPLPFNIQVTWLIPTLQSNSVHLAFFLCPLGTTFLRTWTWGGFSLPAACLPTLTWAMAAARSSALGLCTQGLLLPARNPQSVNTRQVCFHAFYWGCFKKVAEVYFSSKFVNSSLWREISLPVSCQRSRNPAILPNPCFLSPVYCCKVLLSTVQLHLQAH